MKKVKIGNDIAVMWSLFKDGEPYSLEGLDLTLYLLHAFGRNKIVPDAVMENNISWTFSGKDQVHTGKYSLEVVINEGQEGMASTDYVDFVQLTQNTPCYEGEDEENVITENIELASSIAFAPVVIKEGGSGLQYAVERTVYLNRMIYYGEDVDEPIELPEEQKAYNIETADMYFNGNDVFISFASMFFHPAVVAEDVSDGSWKRVEFTTLLPYEGEIDLLSVTITADGNATIEVKKFETGGSVDPELLEGYMPLSRDFSDDFNNDFTR